MKLRSWGSWVLGVALLAGCHSTPPNDAINLNGTEFPILGPYQVITVAPFTLGPKAAEATGLGQQLADSVGSVLRSQFSTVFSTIRVGQPLGQDNEMVVSGLIESFDPQVGQLKLDGRMQLQDASDREDLAYGTFSELRANAGMGKATTAAELVSETGAAIAFNLARAKGWRPAGSP
jgi:hypothetical protein